MENIQNQEPVIIVGEPELAPSELVPILIPRTFKYGLYELSTNQQSNLGTNKHIEFDIKTSGSLNPPSEGMGQEKGIIHLEGGKTYKITGAFVFNHSFYTGQTQVQIYDKTNEIFIGKRFYSVAVGDGAYWGTTWGVQPSLIAIIKPETDIIIEARIIYTDSAILLEKNYSWLLIEEYAGV
jgi:hypothetical protein